MRDKDNGVTVASTAGFCPGVKKAIDSVLALESSGKKPIYTIGPLIHNNQVTETLEAKGIFSIEKLSEATDKNGVLVIRAHGITPEFQKEVESQGMQVVDSTCPLVKKAHTVIEEYAAQGYQTVIVGDAGHAEVIGLLGYTRGQGIVVADEKEALSLPPFKKVNIVAQTTQKEETFHKVAQIIKNKAQEAKVSDTICQPTKQRQKETLQLAKDADLVIVVGGKHSANTARLAKLCSELCPKVLHIEKEDEINKEAVLGYKSVLITAGASTPSWIIETVAEKVKHLRASNKNKFALFLKDVWDFIVNNSIYTSFAAVALTYVCAKLQGAGKDFYLYAISGLSVFSLTLMNKGSSKSAKRNYFITSVISAALAFVLSIKYGYLIYMPMFLFLLLGMAYPFRGNLFRSISYLPGTKDIFTALGWCFVCVFIPAQAQGLLLKKSAYLAFAYGALLVFIRSVILSIGTEYKDIIVGKESFYKAFGLTKTKIAVTVLLISLTAVLLWLLLLGWKVKLVSMLLLGNFYTITTAVYFYSSKIKRSITTETVIDGQFYILAVLSFIAVHFI